MLRLIRCMRLCKQRYADRPIWEGDMLLVFGADDSPELIPQVFSDFHSKLVMLES